MASERAGGIPIDAGRHYQVAHSRLLQRSPNLIYICERALGHAVHCRRCISPCPGLDADSQSRPCPSFIPLPPSLLLHLFPSVSERVPGWMTARCICCYNHRRPRRLSFCAHSFVWKASSCCSASSLFPASTSPLVLSRPLRARPRAPPPYKYCAVLGPYAFDASTTIFLRFLPPPWSWLGPREKRRGPLARRLVSAPHLSSPIPLAD